MITVARAVADRWMATECWHLVVTKVPGTLLLIARSLFLFSLNLIDTKVPVELGALAPACACYHGTARRAGAQCCQASTCFGSS